MHNTYNRLEGREGQCVPNQWGGWTLEMGSALIQPQKASVGTAVQPDFVYKVAGRLRWNCPHSWRDIIVSVLGGLLQKSNIHRAAILVIYANCVGGHREECRAGVLIKSGTPATGCWKRVSLARERAGCPLRGKHSSFSHIGLVSRGEREGGTPRRGIFGSTTVSLCFYVFFSSVDS